MPYLGAFLKHYKKDELKLRTNENFASNLNKKIYILVKASFSRAVFMSFENMTTVCCSILQHKYYKALPGKCYSRPVFFFFWFGKQKHLVSHAIATNFIKQCGNQ